MLNRRGGYESDLTAMRWAEDAFLLVTGAAQGVRDALWIRRHLGPDDFVTVTGVTSAYAVLDVMGPRSRELLIRAGASGLDNGRSRSRPRACCARTARTSTRSGF